MKTHAQCEKMVNQCCEYHDSWSIKSIKSLAPPTTAMYNRLLSCVLCTCFLSVLTRQMCVCLQMLKYFAIIVSTLLLEPGQLMPCFPILHSTYTGPVPFIHHILQSISSLCCHLKPLNNGRGKFSGAGHCLSILLR